MSPNGVFAIEVANDGITLTSGGAELRLTDNEIFIKASGPLELSGVPVEIESTSDMLIQAAATLRLRAALIQQN